MHGIQALPILLERDSSAGTCPLDTIPTIPTIQPHPKAVRNRATAVEASSLHGTSNGHDRFSDRSEGNQSGHPVDARGTHSIIGLGRTASPKITEGFGAEVLKTA